MLSTGEERGDRILGGGREMYSEGGGLRGLMVC